MNDGARSSRAGPDVTTIEDLARLAIMDEKSNPSLRFGYVLKLYFEHAFETEVREQLIALVEDYGKILGDEVTHYMPYEGPA